MAVNPPTACRTPGCGGYAIERGYCKNCFKPQGKEAAKVPAKNDYHREWHALYNTSRWNHPVRGLRVAILRRDPICVECKRNPSTLADHVKDHRGDLVLFYDPKNLRGVCDACHNEKTGTQHGKGSNRIPPTATPVPNVNSPKTNFDFLKSVRQKG